MDREKYVDESWKESANKDKECLAEKFGKETNKDGAATDSSSPKADIPSSSPREQRGDHHPIDESSQNSAEPSDETQINFLNYLSSLGYQAMIFLGEIPHPTTNEVEINLQQAKFIIDTLAMLKVKTKGNLTAKENEVLHSAVYELQMKFVEVSERESAGSL